MLRHLIGLLAGLLIAPLLWTGAAWAATEIGAALVNGNFGAPMAMTSVAALMAIGVVGGLLAGTRISPLAAFASGGLLLAFCLWPLLNAPSLNSLLPDWIGTGTLFHPLGPGLPVVLPLSTLLFISALAPSRWHSSRAAPGGAPPPPVPHTRGPHGPDEPPEYTGEYDGAVPVDDSAKTTTPFRREPGTGAAEPWHSPSIDTAGQTRVFGEDRDRPY